MEACRDLARRREFDLTEEVLMLGPVRLFACSDKGNFGVHWRQLKSIEERQLSALVIVQIGKLRSRLWVNPHDSVLLEMYAGQGIRKLTEQLNAHAHSCQIHWLRRLVWPVLELLNAASPVRRTLPG